MTSGIDNHNANQSLPDATASVGDPLVRAIDEYLQLLDADPLVDREVFLARYPDTAEELRECLEALEFVDGVAPLMKRREHESQARDEFRPLSALGDFRIIREIGRGGMGIVYEAEQLSIGRKVALKVLPFAAVLDPKTLQRFKQEAQAAGALKRPGIVGVHSVGCERGVHYYAMELVEGRSLAQVIASRNEPTQAAGENEDDLHPESETDPVAALSTKSAKEKPRFFRVAAELGVQCAEALEHAHSCGIVHRDVKPSNLLIDPTGHLWVTDFGLAQLEGDATRLTMTGDLLGTLRYMSPEQASGERRVLDHRTDVYSLGITLYELLTGRAAFEGADRGRLLQQIIEEDPKAPREIDTAIPRDLETIVLKAISKEPPARYATAGELAADLQRFLDDKSVLARRPTAANRLLRWCRRNRLVTGLSVCLVGTLLATVFVLAQRSPPGPDRAEPVSSGLSLRLVREGGDEILGNISPEGRRIAYPNYFTANIAVFDLETAGRRDITTEGIWDAPPAEQQYGEQAVWSHNGRLLACDWYVGSAVSGGEIAQLRILAADGSESRVVYEHDDGRTIYPTSWSGDGRNVLVSLWNKKDQITYVLVDVVEETVEELTAFDVPLPQFCQLSPDGRHLVYARAPTVATEELDLYVLDTDTRETSPLVEHLADDRRPFWTPDGRWVVFLSDRGGRAALWAIRCVEGRAQGAPRLVHEQMDGVVSGGFDKQGSFYYSAPESRSDIYVAEVDFKNGAVTGPPRKLESRYEGRNTAADWSPTGRGVVYLSRVGPQRTQLRLTIRNRESRSETEFALGDELRRVSTRADLQWLPDGDSLMMLGFDEDENKQWMLIDAQTGAVSRSIGEDNGWAGMSWELAADGRSLYFTSQWRVFRRDLLTEELRLIHEHAELENGLRNLAVSPDGGRLALTTARDLRILPSEGGEPRILAVADADDALAFALDWTPDGRRLVYGTVSSDAQDNVVTLWQVPVDGGDPQALGIVMKELQYLRIHPGGRQLLFKASSPGRGAQLWAIDNVLAHLNSAE